MPSSRVALVLSAGGLRGAAHVGVLRRLTAANIPVHAIVGVSAGAVIGAYYAAAGLTVDDLVRDAETFRGRHLLTYGVNVQLGYRFAARVDRWCGVIPRRLAQLERARFDRLSHGIGGLGIVCHDLVAGRPRYFGTGIGDDVPLHLAVKASASIPVLFPSVAVTCGTEALRLTDGGVSDPVPVRFAREAFGATHVIVSDCRWVGRVRAGSDTTVWIRPRLHDTGSLWSPRRGLLEAVRAGEQAVTDEHLSTIRGWTALDDQGSAAYARQARLARG